MRIKTKYAGKCRECGEQVPVGVDVEWNRRFPGITCLNCYFAEPDPGPPEQDFPTEQNPGVYGQGEEDHDYPDKYCPDCGSANYNVNTDYCHRCDADEGGCDEPPEPCDECGAPMRGMTCDRCNGEYAMGVADANRFMENRRMLGEDLANAIEIERDLRGLNGDW